MSGLASSAPQTGHLAAAHQEQSEEGGEGEAKQQREAQVLELSTYIREGFTVPSSGTALILREGPLIALLSGTLLLRLGGLTREVVWS